MSKNCLCVVDDDHVFQFLMTKTVEQLDTDLKVIVFSDGEQAYKYIQENADQEETLPDIILLDINMPYMDGWAFIQEYVKFKPNIAKDISIYMVSSSVDKSDVTKAHSIPEISDYITKPITTDMLSKMILNLS